MTASAQTAAEAGMYKVCQVMSRLRPIGSLTAGYVACLNVVGCTSFTRS
jgi:hypothetical protein